MSSICLGGPVTGMGPIIGAGSLGQELGGPSRVALHQKLHHRCPSQSQDPILSPQLRWQMSALPLDSPSQCPVFTSQSPSLCLLPDWLLVITKDLPVSSSPVLGLQAFPTMLWFSVWVLGTKFMSSGSPGKHFTS